MRWGRSILAVVVTAFVIGGMASLVAMGSGAWRPDFSNVPGVSAEDMTALAAPYDDVSQGRDAALMASLVEASAGTQAEIDRIQTLLPPGQPTSSRLTTSRVSTGTGGNQMWGLREYEYAGHVVRAQTTLYRAVANAPWKVSGFHVNVLPRAEIASRALNFMAEPPGVQAVIVAAVVFQVFTLSRF